jgi:hypothetical protein
MYIKVGDVLTESKSTKEYKVTKVGRKYVTINNDYKLILWDEEGVYVTTEGYLYFYTERAWVLQCKRVRLRALASKLKFNNSDLEQEILIGMLDIINS